MLLITDDFVYHSLLTEMFYLHMVVFTYMFSVNHVKVTCHSLFANASYECGTDFYLFIFLHLIAKFYVATRDAPIQLFPFVIPKAYLLILCSDFILVLKYVFFTRKRLGIVFRLFLM